MGQLISAIMNGIATGVPLFLVSSGLTLIYGVMGVLNFAHGALFMIGAYALATLLTGQVTNIGLFLLCAVLAAAVVAAIGMAAERGIFSWLYNAGHMINLLAAYALMLILVGLSILIWGTKIYNVQRPTELAGAVDLGLLSIPVYNLFTIGLGAAVAVGLWLLISKSSYGVKIRAVAYDRTTARALGVRAPLIGMGVFALGGALAGLAGALTAPLISVAPGIDAAYALQSFVIIIIGGLGSIWGALIAALAVGLIQSFLVYYAHDWAAYGMYILVAIVLLFWPQGLFSRSASTAH